MLIPTTSTNLQASFGISRIGVEATRPLLLALIMERFEGHERVRKFTIESCTTIIGASQ